MTKYSTISDIRTERKRLYIKKEMLENEISQDYDDLKESLKPLNLIKDLFTPDKHAQNGQPISPVALNLGSTVLDMVISKVLFNKTSYIKKFLSSYLVHAAGPSVIQKFGPTVFSTLKSLFSSFMQKKNTNPIYEQSTAGELYE